jgi:hypothetical protein
VNGGISVNNNWDKTEKWILAIVTLNQVLYWDKHLYSIGFSIERKARCANSNPCLATIVNEAQVRQ